VRSLYHQAQSFYQKNEFNQAVASLERAYEIQPNTPQISQFLAEISLHQGNNKQAHYWAQIATKNGPSKGSVCEKSWRILAIAAGKTGYYAEQAKALEKKESCQVKIPERF
jgi:predicted Zn-dependent protease